MWHNPMFVVGSGAFSSYNDFESVCIRELDLQIESMIPVPLFLSHFIKIRHDLALAGVARGLSANL